MANTMQNHQNLTLPDARSEAFDTDAQWHTRVRADTAPVNSFTTKTWAKVLSVCLSLLLAFTMFDATALTSYADEVADETTPLAQGADAAASEPETPKGPDAAWAAALQNADIDADSLSALLPGELVGAEEVLPQVTAAAEGAVVADIAGRLAPNRVAYGKPFSASQGFFVKDGAVKADFELGDLGTLLEGGFVAGSKKGDRFVLTMEAPFLYTDAEGNVASTYSEEEWRYRTMLSDVADAIVSGEQGAPADADQATQAAAARAAEESVPADAMRAAVFAEAVPEGWSVFQEHDGAYLPVTDAMMAAGVSGHLVFRYDANDGKLDAAANLPQLSLGLVGGVPEGTPVSVYYGYEYHSFTAQAVEGKPAPEPQYGDVKRGAAGAYSLTNEINDSAAAMAASVVSANMPRTEGGTGKSYLAHTVTYAVPENAPSASAVALGALYPADAQGRGALALETLMAYAVDEDGNPAPNSTDGVVDISDEARKDTSFVGVPGKGGIIVLDVTGLTEEQIASINPMKASSIEALGLEPIAYSVASDGRIQLARGGSEGAIDPGESRTLYIAAPYREADVTFEGDGAESPGDGGLRCPDFDGCLGRQRGVRPVPHRSPGVLRCRARQRVFD